MKKTIILLTIMLLLTGCQTGDNETTITQQNEDCYKYKNDLEQEFAEETSNTFSATLDTIFYYPKTDSCAYTVIEFYYDNEDDITPSDMKVRLYDFFTRNLIDEAQGDETIFDFKDRILE